jgi:hypothetical protein
MNSEEAPRDASFRNEQWAVTDYGLECADGSYPIEKRRLPELRGDVYDWPVHMAEKNWVNLPLFLEAFREALVHHHSHFDVARFARSAAEAYAIKSEQS